MGVKYLTELNSVECVLDRMEHCTEPRFRQIMTSIIAHLHALTKELEPSLEEWAAAIQFLTNTGQACNDGRQEFILLSDILGVSMLVDSINHRQFNGATESTVLGPFHLPNPPLRQMGDNICLDHKGEPLFINGRVLDAAGRPIAEATLDVWHSNQDGFYDVQQPGIQPQFNERGMFRTGIDGRYWFRSAKPCFYPVPTDGPVGQILNKMGRHPYRPAHMHFIISAQGYEPVTTHLFVKGDPYLETDAVFGVKESLIIDFEKHDDPKRAADLGLRSPFYTATNDFILAKSI
jgi:protocatechuate 3,4-dioxygenase beta subunit